MKFSLSFGVVFGVMCLVFNACGEPAPDARPIEGFTPEMQGKGLLIDVRTPEEYAAGHLEGAVNIDWLGPDFETKIQALDKDRELFLYCKAGSRSAKAQKKLREWGFHHTVNLEGGYDAYLKARTGNASD